MNRSPHSRRLVGTFVGAVLLAFAVPMSAGASNPAPSEVIASAGVGTLNVSWSASSVVGTTFIVSSSPTGKGCTVVAVTHCSIVVTDTTPWQFRVRAKVGPAKSAPSALSAPVPTHLVVVLAGQSNAEGARSYVVDPVTKINYFATPFASAADTLDRLTWLAWPKPDMLAPPSSDPVPLTTPQILSGVAVFGTEIGLARQLYADTKQTVTVIKATYPGTALSGEWKPTRTNGLYQQMRDFALATMSNDAAHGQFDVLASYVWFQGESDALLHNTHYRSELAILLHSLRHDLPLNATAPIVVAKESILEREQYEQVHGGCAKDNCSHAIEGNTIIRGADDWAGHHLAHIIVVDSAGLDRTISSRYLHLSNVGELVLGAKIARRIEAFLP